MSRTDPDGTRKYIENHEKNCIPQIRRRKKAATFGRFWHNRPRFGPHHRRVAHAARRYPPGHARLDLDQERPAWQTAARASQGDHRWPGVDDR